MKKSNLCFLVACITLILAGMYTKTLGKEVCIPLPQPLQTFPTELGEYISTDMFRPTGNFHEPSADDWIIRGYMKKGKNRPIFVFVGYWESQNEIKKVGSPRYTRDGWGYYWIRTKTLTTGSNNRMQLKEFLNERGEQKELVYYCYIINGRVVPDEYLFRFLKTVNSLFYGKNNAALLRISVPVDMEFPVEAAELYIEDFIKTFLPFLKDYLSR